MRQTDFSGLVCSQDCVDGCECADNFYSLRRIIKCSDNNITQIPRYRNKEEFTVALHLQDNYIETIPESAVENWQNVDEIHLSGNEIREVQQHLMTARLRLLSLDNNKIRAIPSSVLKKFGEKILQNNLSLTLGNNPSPCGQSGLPSQTCLSRIHLSPPSHIVKPFTQVSHASTASSDPS